MPDTFTPTDRLEPSSLPLDDFTQCERCGVTHSRSIACPDCQDRERQEQMQASHDLYDPFEDEQGEFDEQAVGGFCLCVIVCSLVGLSLLMVLGNVWLAGRFGR